MVIAAGGQRDDFRVVEFNVLGNHLHLIAEAAGQDALARGAGTVNVGNLPATQQVAGSVAVSNLPAVQQVAGTVQVARPTLRHGRGSMRPDSPTTRRQAIPAGVVLTDVRMEGQVFDADPTRPCDVWLYTIEDGFMDVLTTFRLSEAEPFAELHLESGFLPSPTTDSYGFFVGNSSNCIARVFWTGYSVP